jgi:hypothetical protein
MSEEERKTMAMEPLVPTSEEIERARDAYAVAFHKDAEPDDPMMIGRAQIYAMRRQYPAAYELTGKLKLDVPGAFGVIDVGLPNDPKHSHVVLDAEDFLEYALGRDRAERAGLPRLHGNRATARIIAVRSRAGRSCGRPGSHEEEKRGR